MSAFSIFLSTNLFCGTFLAPTISETQDGLREEILQQVMRSVPGDLPSASIRFTIEPDRKLVLLHIEGENRRIHQQITRALSGYQVLTDSVHVFVVYQMSLSPSGIRPDAVLSENSFLDGVEPKR